MPVTLTDKIFKGFGRLLQDSVEVIANAPRPAPRGGRKKVACTPCAAMAQVDATRAQVKSGKLL